LIKGGDQQKKMQEQQQAMEDMKNSILSQVLSQEARARCTFNQTRCKLFQKYTYFASALKLQQLNNEK